jgi:hypothetical protein
VAHAVGPRRSAPIRKLAETIDQALDLEVSLVWLVVVVKARRRELIGESAAKILAFLLREQTFSDNREERFESLRVVGYGLSWQRHLFRFQLIFASMHQPRRPFLLSAQAAVARKAKRMSISANHR